MSGKMEIETWLEKFEDYWKSKNVEKVLDLFADEVDYHETPFKKIEEKELKKEWEAIEDQKDIFLETDVFSKDGEKYTVKWELSYSKDGYRKHFRGIYLIKINNRGKCYDFWQYSVEE